MPGARIKSGERVTLRTVEREDIPFVQRAFTDPEIRYPIGNPLRNQEQIDVSDEKGTDQFLVCLEESDAGPGQLDESDVTPIGQVNVMDADYKRPELGYWLVPEVHGQGYGKEAVSLVIDYVFRTYGHPRRGCGGLRLQRRLPWPAGISRVRGGGATSQVHVHRRRAPRHDPVRTPPGGVARTGSVVGFGTHLYPGLSAPGQPVHVNRPAKQLGLAD